MKKIIITALVFTIPFVKSYAQPQLGVKAGLNVAQIQNYQFSKHDKTKLAMNCGLLARFKFNKELFIQPEILYSTKGIKFPETSYNGSDLSLNYLSVPVLLGFQLNKKLAFLIGPETSFLINAKTSYDDDKQNNTITYNRFDLAIDLGIEFNINTQLAFEVRYSYGFPILTGAILSHPSVDYYLGIKNGSNQLLQFDLIYLFKVH